mgnify:FL=1
MRQQATLAIIQHIIITCAIDFTKLAQTHTLHLLHHLSAPAGIPFIPAFYIFTFRPFCDPKTAADTLPHFYSAIDRFDAIKYVS